jgi:O-antigen/teichoic acid export membrane protein
MGFSLMLSNLFSGMMPINETFLVNNIIKDEVISANFKVAGLFPAQLLMVSSAIVVYYFPIVARRRADAETWKQIKTIGVVTFFVVVFVAGLGALLTPWVIQYVYGEKYADATMLSYVLWIMRALNAGMRVVPLNMLPALGETKFNAWCAAISCVVMTLLDYYLLTAIGITGVAYGAIAVYCLSGIALWGYLYRVCHKKA